MPDVIDELRRYGEAVEAAAMAETIDVEALQETLASVEAKARARKLEASARRRLLVATVVVVVFLGVLGAVLVTRSDNAPVGDVVITDPSREPEDGQPAPDTSGGAENDERSTPDDILTDAGNWRHFEAGELAVEPGINGVWRQVMTAVWTGRELVLWGGAVDGGPTYADGAALDPTTSSWRSLAPTPLDARSDHVAVWTGDEMVVWGGVDRYSQGGREFDDGAAYDPDSDTWRLIAESPLTGGGGYTAVWTGDEVVVVGGTGLDFDGSGQVPGTRYNEAAAYDPHSNTWRTFPDMPVDLSFVAAHWTGDEVIAVGGQTFNSEAVVGLTGEVMGVVLDLGTGTWRELPPSGISAQAATTVWTDGALYVFTYAPQEDGARAWVRDRNAWEDRPPIPARPCEDVPIAVSYPGGIIASLCDMSAAYVPATQTWTTISPPESLGEGDHFTGFSWPMVWSGTEVLAPHGDGTVWGYTP